MRRRDFIRLLGGAAAWPLAAAAQQVGRMRRVGVLMSESETDPAVKAQFGVFVQGLRSLGWIDGQNLRLAGVGLPPSAACLDVTHSTPPCLMMW